MRSWPAPHSQAYATQMGTGSILESPLTFEMQIANHLEMRVLFHSGETGALSAGTQAFLYFLQPGLLPDGFFPGAP